MNRVIENALRDGPVGNSQLYHNFEEKSKDTVNCNSKDSSSSKLDKEENNTLDNDTLKLNSSQSISSLDSVNSLPLNLNINSNNNNSNNNNVINSNTSNITTQQSSNPNSEDKPLNLSSSKMLHTSNQQIIDHFIDKWLGSSHTGNYTNEVERVKEEYSCTCSLCMCIHVCVCEKEKKERMIEGERENL